MTGVLRTFGHGFLVAGSPQNLFFCLVGALCGTLIGVLPGLGPVATISLLLPATYALDPIGAIIMLSGIYYGAQYGGSTTAILMNIPGESTRWSPPSTAIAWPSKAGQGRRWRLRHRLVHCGLCGLVRRGAAGPPLARMAQKFESPDYFSLMVLGLVSAVVLASGSVFRAVAMVLLGLLLGLVGADIHSGMPRMTFGLSSSPTASVSSRSPWACSESPKS